MAVVLGWIGLLLIGYFFIALFCVERGSKRVLRVASGSGDLQSEARNTLGSSYWSRLVWIKKHKLQLPTEAQPLAQRVVTMELSARIALALLFITYGVHLVAL
jgi:hypothetical protein